MTAADVLESSLQVRSAPACGSRVEWSGQFDALAAGYLIQRTAWDAWNILVTTLYGVRQKVLLELKEIFDIRASPSGSVPRFNTDVLTYYVN